MIANGITYKRNCKARYASQEEKVFTRAATAGLLLFWNPYAAKGKIASEKLVEEANSTTSTAPAAGLPLEIGYLIGAYLNRFDAKQIVQVCHSANHVAKKERKNYIQAHGQSYSETAYIPFIM
ncbi:hypothetical protein EAW55_00390 [Legionella jordanis]|nr:hypothetical protein EAW55_00390 [Legionella jordanis]RMX17416.1 hypothetical protein EAS68_11020 [Legionella jordanis]